ncbi:MAG TPA: hypothetical protein VF103_01830, partial [Polyangiaceae bacterium]
MAGRGGSGGSDGLGGAGVGGYPAGSGGSGGSSGTGTGGSAGAPDDDPTECRFVPSSRGPCEGGCTLNAAFALRCPSSFYSLEVAGSNLLLDHQGGSDLFGFHFEGGLIGLGHWNPESPMPRLTTTGDEPIV